MESGRKDWYGLVRDGREPLAHALLVLLHPAECSAEGPLRDLKGNTSRARWVEVPSMGLKALQ